MPYLNPAPITVQQETKNKLMLFKDEEWSWNDFFLQVLILISKDAETGDQEEELKRDHELKKELETE